MLLENDGLFSITTMPAKPIMESFSPVLPNALRGIGTRLLAGCSAFARGSSILAELINPTAVPAFKNSRLSITSLLRSKAQSVIIGFFRAWYDVGRERFPDDHDAVHIGILQYLLDAAGPANLDFFYVPVRSESEMHPAIAGGCISDSSCYLVPLRPSVFCGDAYLGSDPHPVAS